MSHNLTQLSELRHLHSLQSLRYLDVTVPVPERTPPTDLQQVRDEFDSDEPATFRRDRWPHFSRTHIHFFGSIHQIIKSTVATLTRLMKVGRKPAAVEISRGVEVESRRHAATMYVECARRV